ncbi:uncharacterized protein BDR25DRAFT_386265 [Lindgomyces ingoldianus]|uniref:Uncharacterized protein n=1 Tax=Lindgomyces ingoldianus TaxID=673940 RepID=A0ACB6Q6W4_9PLEO|nr:uncharacterized protein BDR25DRAFT_386265 [Lindgomyces ingoldianus]KAF2462689.1 hypothetical protein BDR25DRAFT_386265 [Lindgomyces ingoldianus]
MQEPRTNPRHEATMESTHRGTPTEGNKNSERDELPGRLNRGHQPLGYEDHLYWHRPTQLMYACSVWLHANTKKTLNTLKAIQARVARAICGAYKVTSRATLDIKAYLLLIEQQLWKHNTNTITRLLSSQEILDRPETHIDDDADKARSRHDRENDTEQDLSIYTDGSGINGQIGVAAACPILQQIRSVHMGMETTSTIYSAELRGISALQIAREYAERNRSRQTVAVDADNQAAITSTA